MAISETNYTNINAQLQPKGVTLVAVSKTKPAADIAALYALGQRDFGENYVQELTEKQPVLPADIRWHFIGHLQSNKVKYIAPFVYMIHGVDSLKLLQEINKQAAKNQRTIACLLQVHVAQEETKFGMDAVGLAALIEAYRSNKAQYANVLVKGIMGMASFTDDQQVVKSEFAAIRRLFTTAQASLNDTAFDTISMGMSGDYALAIEAGSTMVRIGSLLFGTR
ncbi:YggS family pyridoxal phosphate-dependent enzyme [Deminuibacter soli]|uniref:Pyridoxal phosphate homeostasis protein n=1 Tax=Deminuibacter soli TaxID=2291815 RepID=A0A3E1NJN4_9BACT|nr:YggS family pyridoxal phosphate-dependent enzyme [Deminuibacter soli]RFM27998.1 YggS family pyridoxal phosphate-dependent enzyme [Deminuibacter soli]